ncbi:MAG: HAD hydrolase family protein [Bacteroidetes bacterium]|nr:HAD hydrolase family protein [Bacteroidota bacterium]
MWVSKELNIKLIDIAYIGDDLNDLKCMEQVGIAACPADAVDKIKKISHIVLNRNGGDACVREFIDMHWDI